MKSPSLMILAAGLGSRYQGLKQMDGMGPKGTSLLEYSLYDAIQAGFRKFIFIISHPMKEAFVSHIKSRLPDDLDLRFVIQDTGDLPGDFGQSRRVKPWGTAHAVYAGRQEIDEAFGVINGDDYYGPSAFKKLYKHLKEKDSSVMVAYRLDRTLSSHGGVSRGICQVSQGYLRSIEEVEGIRLYQGYIQYPQKDLWRKLAGSHLVSMNMWGFPENQVQDLEGFLLEFLRDYHDHMTQEAFLPAWVQASMDRGLTRVKVLTCQEDWFGVTYPQDRQEVASRLLGKIEEGTYPLDLWDWGLEAICGMFSFKGAYESIEAYGDGHIHKTYKVAYSEAGRQVTYILQAINHQIFKRIDLLMDNIVGVTDYLAGQAYPGLEVIRTKGGQAYYQHLGTYYRAYNFVENSQVFTLTDDLKIFEAAGQALGDFQLKLKDFPAHQLHETIVDFHHSPKRGDCLRRAKLNDPMGRLNKCQDLLDFVEKRWSYLSVLIDQDLPVTVTHNDTKLNNILFDQKTGQALCLIDLDTVMPGYRAYDYGDALRSCASSLGEDDDRYDQIDFDLSRFRALSQGYLSQLDGHLSKSEVASLVDGVILMTLECGIRFLTDYLEGDTYFKVLYTDHNLVRARNQLSLVAKMEEKKSRMQAIIDEIIGGLNHGTS